MYIPYYILYRNYLLYKMLFFSIKTLAFRILEGVSNVEYI